MQARQRLKKKIQLTRIWKAKGSHELLRWNFEFWARYDAQGEIKPYL